MPDAIKLALEVLREREWITTERRTHMFCWRCDQWKSIGHRDNCRLDAAIRGLEAEKGEGSRGGRD